MLRLARGRYCANEQHGRTRTDLHHYLFTVSKVGHRIYSNKRRETTPTEDARKLRELC